MLPAWKTFNIRWQRLTVPRNDDDYGAAPGIQGAETAIARTMNSETSSISTLKNLAPGDKIKSPAMIQLEHWAPTPIVSRRDRHAAEVWNPHMVNRFPPKKPNEGSVVQAPWARCRDNVIHRRATRLGAVGARRVDPTYLPAHTVCAFSETELDALRAIGGSLAHGLVKKRDVKRLMAACFPNENVAAAKARHCGRDLHVSKHRHGTFPGVCAWIATSRLSVNRAAKHPHNNLKIPLPPCCANPACRICVMSLSPQQLNDMSPEVRQMYTMWRSLVDHGGEGVTFNGVEECLAKHGVPLPTDEVAEVFERYDADGSNHLDFDEFMGLLDDLRVGDKIVRKRVTAYSLPPDIAKDYTDEEVAQLAHSFGLYDDSGDGVMDMKELEAAMVSLGHSLEEHELKFMLSMASISAGKGRDVPKGSSLGRFPLVSADFWTSDHLSERSRSVDVFFWERAPAEHPR